jgi:ubiquinone/menaquinone biosynthesis C-methylase UbiE
MPVFLHVGCGRLRKDRTTKGFNTADWRELRLDIDPQVKPDVVGAMTDMHAVPDACMDAVYSSHNIEHLYPFEVPLALAEFQRVLRPEGFVVITCPDLRSVAALVAQDRLTEPAYTSSAGPISPLDMIFGHQTDLAKGNFYMAHRTGFTSRTLEAALREAGFASVVLLQRPWAFELWALATKAKRDRPELRALIEAHFPLRDTA